MAYLLDLSNQGVTPLSFLFPDQAITKVPDFRHDLSAQTATATHIDTGYTATTAFDANGNVLNQDSNTKAITIPRGLFSPYIAMLDEQGFTTAVPCWLAVIIAVILFIIIIAAAITAIIFDCTHAPISCWEDTILIWGLAGIGMEQVLRWTAKQCQ